MFVLNHVLIWIIEGKLVALNDLEPKNVGKILAN